MKSDLYYRPDACGYTGIRDHAGVYSLEEAKRHASPEHGVEMIPFEEGPEITKACYTDLAIKHLQGKLASLPALIEAAEQALEVLSAEAIGTHNPDNQEWYESVCKAGDALREALSSIKGGK